MNVTFYEKKSFYIPCSDFVTVLWSNIKIGAYLCNLGMTKSEIIFIIRPFTEIENFVIREKY